MSNDRHSHPPAALLLLALIVLGVIGLATLHTPSAAQGSQPFSVFRAAPNPWQSASASWYRPTGNKTSCGKTMTDSTWLVAALKKSEYRCGRKLSICHRHVCVTVAVQDRGAWRSDNRLWDLSKPVKRALRCSDLCDVKWREIR